MHTLHTRETTQQQQQLIDFMYTFNWTGY